MHLKLNKKGFTLLEIVVALCILFILIALMVPTFSNFGKNASEQMYEADALMIYTNVNQILYEDISIRKENQYNCKDGCNISSIDPKTPEEIALITKLNTSIDNLNGYYVIDFQDTNLTVLYYDKDNKSTKYDGKYSSQIGVSDTTSSNSQITTTTTITTRLHEETTITTKTPVVTSSTKRTSTTRPVSDNVIEPENASERWFYAMLLGFRDMYENRSNKPYNNRCSYSYEEIINLPDEEKLTLSDLALINNFISIDIDNKDYEFESNRGNFECKNFYHDESMTFPEILTEITSIESIEFKNMKKFVGSLPTDFSKLTNLEELILDSEMIEGPLPDSLFDIRELEEIYISNTRISYVPDAILEKLKDPNFKFIINFHNSNNVDKIYPIRMSQKVYDALRKCKKCNFDYGDNNVAPGEKLPKPIEEGKLIIEG